MIEIKPFKALVYNKEKVKDFKKVVAPPYDVILKKERDAYYNLSKYNVIRLILGKIYAKDSKGSNRYSRASDFLNKWKKEQALLRDEKPAFYVYLQKYYDIQKKKMQKRLGFISLFKLEEFSKKSIYPHEWTLSKPKVDRFELIKSTGANYSPVFSLYYDKKGEIDKILKKATRSKPFIKVRDEDKTEHILYRITDIGEIEKIKKIMRGKKLFIADGHHRYETALKFRDYYKRLKGRKNTEADYTLMCLTNLDNKGLKIYPINRLVKNISIKNVLNLEDNLKRYFHLIEVKSKVKMLSALISSKSSDYRFGLYYQKKFYLFWPKDKKIINQISKKKKLSCVDKLNVTLLHKLVINDFLKADNEDHVRYFHNAQDVIDGVGAKKNSVGFFASAITADEIIKAALAGERMPHKSTYFYPKLYSGLAINQVEDF